MTKTTIASAALYWYLQAKGQDRMSIETAAEVLGGTVGQVGKLELDDRLRKAAKSISLASTTKNPVNEVFRHWLKATGRDDGRTKLTSGRRAKIKTRLGEGYTIEELCSAVDGCLANPWNQGENPRNKRYDSVDLIFRNGEKVEGYMEDAGKGRAPTGQKASETTSFAADSDADISETIYGGTLLETVQALAKLSPAAMSKWAQPAADWHMVSRQDIERRVTEARNA